MKLKSIAPLIIIIIIICFACKKETAVDKAKTLPFYNSEDFTPEWISKTDEKYNKIHTINEFEFTNQNGKKIDNNDVSGKIHIADFFFTTCPGICPILVKNMSKIQEVYQNDEDIILLSYSVMPGVDTVDKINEYASEKNIIDNKWHLLTGDKNEIYHLARTSYFADEDFKKTKDEDEFIHTENFILVDKKGRIRGVYNGTLALEIERLKRHINLLKNEV